MTETAQRPQAPGAEDGPIGRFLRATELDPRLIGQIVPLKIERASVSTLYGELQLAGVDS